ncbi:MAG: formylglycine-generating enzyme family protein, partial [Bacteroidales bacterium]|nr:formylglycine-generating enzyme family protein [Bacteroidales bacterium]
MIENEEIQVGDVKFNMIHVEGGMFLMGAQRENKNGDNYDAEAWSSESPVHKVTLRDYYIGETPVTQELWRAVMGKNPSHFKGAKKPVETVSWEDCQNFIRKLNLKTRLKFRLPTEA